MNKNIENIYEDLLELSDLNLQKKLWLNNDNDTGHISSYMELMNRLFDDDNFDLFIDKGAGELGFEPNLILKLDQLRSLLNSYEEGTKTDSDIVIDPQWSLISNHASLAVKAWNEESKAQSARESHD
jgi:hypothetical protein